MKGLGCYSYHKKQGSALQELESCKKRQEKTEDFSRILLKEYQNDRRFENRSNEFVATINEMTGSRFRLNSEGGNVNMREGLRKLQEEAAREATREAEKKAALKAEAKETESIRNSYELMEEVAPDLDRESKVQLIARKFKKSVRYVNSILA